MNKTLELYAPIYKHAMKADQQIYDFMYRRITEMSSGEHSNIGVVSFAIGISLMMVLDVALG